MGGGGEGAGTRSVRGQDGRLCHRGGGAGGVSGISSIYGLRTTAFVSTGIKSRDFRDGTSRGSSFMIPSNSFSTSVSLQTEMPRQTLVVKTGIY